MAYILIIHSVQHAVDDDMPSVGPRSIRILLDPAGHSPHRIFHPQLTWSESPNSDNSISSPPNFAHPQITNLWVSGLQSKTDLNKKTKTQFHCIP
jgi:hypothetical protein